MRTIDQINFAHKRALIRVDFNVPLDADFKITDDKRMRAAIPTITKILNDGGSVVLMSHLGRPKGGAEDKYSLRHILADLSKMIGTFSLLTIAWEPMQSKKQLTLQTGKFCY
jgi:phosphoglycerate kinase